MKTWDDDDHHGHGGAQTEHYHHHDDAGRGNHGSDNSKVQLACLYSRHKTQKKKRWSDGRLVISHSSKLSLHDANPPPGSSDPPLDETEICRSQAEAVMAMRETDVEFDKFLVTIEGPWRGRGHLCTKVTPPVPTASAGMRRVLGTKFRRPSTRMPPPNPEEKMRRRQMAERRRGPLQPGELERRYYGGGGGGSGGDGGSWGPARGGGGGGSGDGRYHGYGYGAPPTNGQHSDSHPPPPSRRHLQQQDGRFGGRDDAGGGAQPGGIGRGKHHHHHPSNLVDQRCRDDNGGGSSTGPLHRPPSQSRSARDPPQQRRGWWGREDEGRMPPIDERGNGATDDGMRRRRQHDRPRTDDHCGYPPSGYDRSDHPTGDVRWGGRRPQRQNKRWEGDVGGERNRGVDGDGASYATTTSDRGGRAGGRRGGDDRLFDDSGEFDPEAYYGEEEEDSEDEEADDDASQDGRRSTTGPSHGCHRGGGSHNHDGGDASYGGGTGVPRRPASDKENYGGQHSPFPSGGGGKSPAPDVVCDGNNTTHSEYGGSGRVRNGPGTNEDIHVGRHEPSSTDPSFHHHQEQTRNLTDESDRPTVSNLASSTRRVSDGDPPNLSEERNVLSRTDLLRLFAPCTGPGRADGDTRVGHGGDERTDRDGGGTTTTACPDRTEEVAAPSAVVCEGAATATLSRSSTARVYGKSPLPHSAPSRRAGDGTDGSSSEFLTDLLRAETEVERDIEDRPGTPLGSLHRRGSMMNSPSRGDATDLASEGTWNHRDAGDALADHRGHHDNGDGLDSSNPSTDDDIIGHRDYVDDVNLGTSSESRADRHPGIVSRTDSIVVKSTCPPQESPSATAGEAGTCTSQSASQSVTDGQQGMQQHPELDAEGKEVSGEDRNNLVNTENSIGRTVLDDGTDRTEAESCPARDPSTFQFVLPSASESSSECEGERD